MYLGIFILITFLCVYFSVLLNYDFSFDIIGNSREFYSMFVNLNAYSIYTPIWGDGYGHYVFLPAFFIEHNFSLDFVRQDAYYITELLKPLMRYPIGEAILVSPFFLAAHFLTKITNYFEVNGFSLIYQIFVIISTFFYWAIGIIFSYKIFAKRMAVPAAICTCALITFGCGMYYYLVFAPAYAHIYSFCFISLFIWQILNEKTINTKYALKLGLLLGIITIIRNMNVLIFLFFLFYNINNFNEFKDRIKKILNYKFILPFLAIFLVVLSPLMFHWFLQTGHLIINAYSVYADAKSLDNFAWLSPHIVNNLFSKEVGLFLYYPVIILSFVGLFYLNKYAKNVKFSILISLLIFIYFVSAWNCWWYGFSFGPRPYIDIMSIFGILMSFAINEIIKIKNTILKLIIFLIISYMVIYSLILMINSRNYIYNYLMF